MTTMSRSGARSTPPMLAVLSTIALVLISIAVPVVLVTVGGSPIPSGGLRRLRLMLDHGQGFDAHVVTSWILHGALLLAWVTWAWMLVCLAIELVSWLTGRTPASLPGSRTMQAVAACLVGTSLAVVTVGRALPAPTVKASPTPVAPSAPVSRAFEPSQTTGRYVLFRRAQDDAERAPEALPVLRVVDDYAFGPSRPGTADHQGLASMSAVSTVAPNEEQHDATASVEEIAAPAQARRDGDVPPGSGSARIVAEVASGQMEPSPRSEPGAADKVYTVSGRETLWSIAEDRLGSAQRWREIAELNYSVLQPDGRSLTDDHWVEPGWRLVLPAPTVDAREYRTTGRARSVASVSTTGRSPIPRPSSHWKSQAARPVPSKTEMPGSSIRGSENAPRPTTASRLEPTIISAGFPAPLELIGAGLLGAGAVALLERMRRAQTRHRRDGKLIVLPDAEGIITERRLRSGDGRYVAETLNTTLARFVQSFVDRGRAIPRILGVQYHPEQIELRLMTDDSVDEVESSDRSGGSSVFLALAEADLGQSAADPVARNGRSMCPTLVTVGRTPSGPLLVNLQAIGSLALTGASVACEGVVRALALELATSPWGSRFDLVLVGFGAELNRFERVNTTSDLSALVDQLHRRRVVGAGASQGPRRSTVTASPVDAVTGELDPMVVICAPGLDTEDVIDLISAGSDPQSKCVVVACGNGFQSEHRLEVSDEDGASSVLEPLGSVVFPNRVSQSDLERVCSLVDTAMDHRSVSFDESPYDTLSIPTPRHPSTVEVDGTDDLAASGDARRADDGAVRSQPEFPVDPFGPHPEIQVCVLGPVEIHGAARPFTRAWSKELVVYLAMHPHGATNDAWATALWPDRLMAASSLHSTASVARRSLGQCREGRDHLPRAHGRLALADSVGTDWDEFVRLAETDELSSMRRALELVRGRPFDGLRASDWPILEGVAPAIEAAVVDVAGRLAGRYLREGDATGAEWSSRKGLLVSPYDERLYRMLLRAADLAGNPAGVESVMSELIRLVADDVEPFDSVHPSTMELYRSLTRRKALAASPR